MVAMRGRDASVATGKVFVACAAFVTVSKADSTAVCRRQTGATPTQASGEFSMAADGWPVGAQSHLIEWTLNATTARPIWSPRCSRFWLIRTALKLVACRAGRSLRGHAKKRSLAPYRSSKPGELVPLRLLPLRIVSSGSLTA